MFTNLVLCGAGLKGLTYIGCVKYMIEHKISSSIKNIIGSSIGSLIGYLICFNLSYKIFDDIVNEIMNNVNNDDCINIDNLFNIYEELGIKDMDVIMNAIDKFLPNHAELTFIDFTKKTGINFIVVASNLHTGKSDYFTVDTHPHLKVCETIKASCAIPYIFKPIWINNNLYVDAGLFNNIPLDYFERFSTPFVDTLILKTGYEDMPFPCDNINIVTYTNQLLKQAYLKLNEKSVPSSNLLVNIMCTDDQFWGFNNDLSFSVDINNKNKYINLGYETMKNNLPNK